MGERRRSDVSAVVSGLALCVLVACGNAATPAGDELSERTAALSAQELAQVLADAAVRRVTVDDSLGGEALFGRVEVVETVGSADPNGFLDARRGRPLTDDERAAIVGALEPLPIDFVAATVFDELDPMDDPAGRAIVTLAEPAEVDGQVAVTSQLWCGGLCGTGGAHELLRRDDGTWMLGEPVGPQWIS